MQLQGGIRVDLVGHELSDPNGRVRSLTVLEADALRFLGQAANAPVKRIDLERQVWGFRAGTRSEAVPVAMRRLRAKVGDALETVRGVGWRLHVLEDASATSRAPTPSTAWFPRPDLEAALQAVLGRRTVAVVGAGGYGKTRLVRALVPDDHLFVPLPPERLDLAALCGAVTAALGLASARPDGVLAALGERPGLLWLDGAHALDDDAMAWLAPLPATVLTVREAPQVHDVAVVEVPRLTDDEARAFLRDRCAPTVMSARAEVAVLHRCGGNPSMLERAASLAWMGAELVMAELETTDDDPFVSRAWSELAPASQAVLRVASALAGPTSPQDLRALVPSLAAVPELRRRALLQVDHEGRLVVPGTVQRFVTRQPDPDGDVLRARAEVVAWATRALNDVPHDPRPAIARLKELRRTLEAVTSDPRSPHAGAAALALSLGLGHFGLARDRIELLTRVLGFLADDHPDGPALRRELAWSLRATGASRKEFETVVHGDRHPIAVRLRAIAAYEAGEHEAALAAFDEVVARAAPGTVTHIYALVQRASRQDLVTRRDAALREADLTSALEQAEDVRLCLPEVLRSTARVRAFDGDVAEARRLIARAIDITEANGQDHKLGELWNSMGVCMAEADPAAASEAFRTSLGHMNRIGNVLFAPSVRCNLALCLYVSDDLAGAREFLAPLLSQHDKLRGQHLAWLLALALDTAAGNIQAVRWRAQIEPRELGRHYGRDAVAHGQALIRLAEAADDVAAGGSPKLEALLEELEPLAAEPTATTLRMLRDHAQRALDSPM